MRLITLAVLVLFIPVCTAFAAEIHDAARAGDLATVKALVEKDPTLVKAVNTSGATPLHLAAAMDRREVVAYLLEKAAVVDQRDAMGRTPLWLCADRGSSVVIAKLLLDKGADPNAVGTGLGRSSPFLMAAHRGGEALVDLLLEHGAVLPAASDPATRRLLTQSASKGLVKLMDRLVASGADLRTRDDRGASLLHHGAAGGSVGIIEILTTAGLPVNEATRAGWQPLHYAAEAGHPQAVELLLAKGASLNARTRDGKSALNLAREWGKTDVVARLAARGADPDEPKFPLLAGPYFGQKPPGKTPEPFAPGIVATKYPFYGGITFSPDGSSAFWSLMDFGGRMATLESRLVGGRWTLPKLAWFQAAGVSDSSPFPSPDGRKCFFHSNRPLEKGGANGKTNLWVMERKGAGWSEAQPLPSVINALPLHWQYSVDLKGNLYFGANREAPRQMEQEIFWSRYENGLYAPPERLGPAINGPGSNFAPFIAPDGSYLIVTRLDPQTLMPSLFISYRGRDGAWTPARDLHDVLGANVAGSMPWVTPDGKYLFFLDVSGPSWVDAGFIEELRKQDRLHLDDVTGTKGRVTTASATGRQEAATDLLARAFERLRAKDYPGALALYDRILAGQPGHADALYHRAIVLALTNKRTAAAECLRQAIDAGFSDIARIVRDPGVSDLRGEAAYDAALREFDLVLSEERAPSLENIKRILAEPRFHRFVPRLLPRYRSPDLTRDTLQLLESSDARLQRAAIVALLHQNADDQATRARVAALLANPSADLRGTAAEYLLWHGTQAERESIARAAATESDPFTLAALQAAARQISLRGGRAGLPASSLDVTSNSKATRCQEAIAVLSGRLTVDVFRQVGETFRTGWDVEPKLLYRGPDVDAKALAEQRACFNLAASIFRFTAKPAGATAAGATSVPVASSFMAPVRNYFNASRKSFGSRTGDGGPFRSSVHAGDDAAWGLDDGTVVSVADGVVRLASYVYSWGFIVVVEHKLPGREGYYCSLYGHLAPSLSVASGQVVRKNERLGALGRSHTFENGGYPSHLHFGIHRGPYVQSPPMDGNGVLAPGGASFSSPFKPSASWVSGYVGLERWADGFHGWVDPQRFLSARMALQGADPHEVPAPGRHDGALHQQRAPAFLGGRQLHRGAGEGRPSSLRR